MIKTRPRNRRVATPGKHSKDRGQGFFNLFHMYQVKTNFMIHVSIISLTSGYHEKGHEDEYHEGDMKKLLIKILEVMSPHL